MVEGRSQRIDVALRFRAAILNLLKRRVTRRVTKDACVFRFFVFMAVPLRFARTENEEKDPGSPPLHDPGEQIAPDEIVLIPADSAEKKWISWDRRESGGLIKRAEATTCLTAATHKTCGAIPVGNGRAARKLRKSTRSAKLCGALPRQNRLARAFFQLAKELRLLETGPATKFDPVPFDHAIEGFAINSEDARGRLLITAAMSKHARNVVRFHRRQRHPLFGQRFSAIGFTRLAGRIS